MVQQMGPPRKTMVLEARKAIKGGYRSSSPQLLALQLLRCLACPRQTLKRTRLVHTATKPGKPRCLCTNSTCLHEPTCLVGCLYTPQTSARAGAPTALWLLWKQDRQRAPHYTHMQA